MRRAPTALAPTALVNVGLVAAGLVIGVLVTGVLTTLGAVAARADDPLSAFGETVEVDLVNVEVVVTDRDGNPVSGLETADFTLLEDGEPVEILNFYAVDRRRAAGSTAPDPLPADATRRLSLVVLVDRAGLRIENRMALFEGLDSALDRAVELDGQVMLATVDTAVDVQVPFTRDAATVREALDRLAREASPTALDSDRRLVVRNLQNVRLPSFDAMNPFPFESAVTEAERLIADLQNLAEKETRRVMATSAAVQHFLDSIAGLPGRKAVLFLSDGLASRLGEGFAELWRAKFQRWLDENRLGVPASSDAQIQRNVSELDIAARYDTRKDLEALARRAAEHRVTFYPVAVGGVDGGLGADSNFSSRGAAVMEAFARETSLIDIAETTGGKAWLKGVHLEATLDGIARDSETYYSLGYEPPSPRDGKFHRLEVQVRGEGLLARTARGYRDKEPSERLREQTLAALLYGGGANALDIRLEPGEPKPSSQGGKRSVLTVKVFIPYRHLLLVPEADSHLARLTLVVAVRDVASGNVSTPQELALPVRIPNARLGEALNGIAVYPLELDLEAGGKLIAVAVRDQLARVDALARLEVTVGAPAGGG